MQLLLLEDDILLGDGLSGYLRTEGHRVDWHHKALMRRYALFGPPALLFFRPVRPETKQARVIGFQAPAQFAQNLERFGSSL